MWSRGYRGRPPPPVFCRWHSENEDILSQFSCFQTSRPPWFLDIPPPLYEHREERLLAMNLNKPLNFCYGRLVYLSITFGPPFICENPQVPPNPYSLCWSTPANHCKWMLRKWLICFFAIFFQIVLENKKPSDKWVLEYKVFESLWISNIYITLHFKGKKLETNSSRKLQHVLDTINPNWFCPWGLFCCFTLKIHQRTLSMVKNALN